MGTGEPDSWARTGLTMKAAATAAARTTPLELALITLHSQSRVIGSSGLAQEPASTIAGTYGMLNTSLGKQAGVGCGRGCSLGMVSKLSDIVTEKPKHLPSGHGTSLFAQLVQTDWQSLNRGSVLLN